MKVTVSNQLSYKYPILFLIFLFSLSLQAKINYEGVDAKDIGKLEERFPSLKSNKVKLSTLDQVIQFLMGTDTYSQVKIEKKADASFAVVASRLQKVGRIQVFGNNASSADEVVSALGLKPGVKFDGGKIIEAGEKLKEFYGRRGFFNSIVSFDFTTSAENELDIMVKIREREPCRIEDIVIESANYELSQKLQSRTKKHLGENFTESSVLNIESTINDYLRSNRFVNSQLLQKSAKYNSTKTRAILSYELTDPYTYEVFFTGNIAKTNADLLRAIKIDELTKGSLEPAQDVAAGIKNYYLSQGYANIKVTYDDKTFADRFNKRIYVTIEEGPRVKLKNIEVVGRISQTAKSYASFVKENSSEIVDDGYYVKPDLEKGFNNLIIHLNNQGYLRAKVQSTRVEYNDEKNEVNLTVTMDEGPLTQLGKIEFAGLKAFSNQQLLDILDIKPSAPLRLYELESSIQKLKQHYYTRGYIEMKLLNEDSSLVEYNENSLQANVKFRIKEGPQIFVKSVVVEGNTFTKDYVILLEAGIDAGDLVNPELLEEVQKRLDKLAIFSRVELRTLEEGTDVSQRTFVILVTERSPGLFKFGVGVTNKRELTARGFAGVSYNNIGGKARAVSLRGTVENNIPVENYLEYEVGVSYLEPFLFGNRLRGRAGYTRSERIFEEDDASANANLQATDSFKFTLERDITSRIKFSWLALGFDSVEQFDLPEKGARTRESRLEIAYVGPSLDLDYTDNLFLPTKGHYTKLDAEYAAPELGSTENVQFIRTQGLFTHYTRVRGPKIIWANSVRGGYAKNLSNEAGSGVPFSFAFFIGGYTTLRGYSGSFADRVPNSSEFSYDSDSQLIIPKESSFYLVKSELRFPLWADPFGGAVFYDGGQVDVQGFSFQNPYRQSVGVGVRINTPVGPISLDYGRKLNPQRFSGQDKKESPDQWHLSIGTF